MKKTASLRSNKKGFTLVELIVGLAILGIVIAVAMSLISPISNDYSSSSEKSAAQSIATSIVNEIKQKTNNSTALAAKDSSTVSYTTSGETKEITASGGYLYIDGSKPYSDDFYKNDTITMDVSANSETANTVDVTLTVLGQSGKSLYKTTCTLQPTLVANKSTDTDPGTGDQTDADKTLKEYNITAQSWDELIASIKADSNYGRNLKRGTVYYDIENGQKVYGVIGWGPYMPQWYAKKNPTITDYFSDTAVGGTSSLIIKITSLTFISSDDQWKGYGNDRIIWKSGLPKYGNIWAVNGSLYCWISALSNVNETDPTTGNWIQMK